VCVGTYVCTCRLNAGENCPMHVTVFETLCGNVCHAMCEREGESLFSRIQSHNVLGRNVLGRNVLGCACVTMC